jgi:hypothetical protein
LTLQWPFTEITLLTQVLFIYQLSPLKSLYSSASARASKSYSLLFISDPQCVEESFRYSKHSANVC